MHLAGNLRITLFLASVLLLLPNLCALAHTDVTAQQARDLIDSTPGLVVVDVRERYEYCDAVGHIPGARNYPWNSGVLQARYEELPMDRPILVVCRSGGRSNAAATFLDSRGFSMVYDMLGGMSAWIWETAPCKYASGSGIAEDPYQIATTADLITLGETPDDYDKHFILTADLDFGRRVFDKAVIAPDANDAEDGFQGTSFTGVFDGNGHTISHLTVTGGSYLGLFGLLGSGAKVSNLGIEAMNVSGTGGHVGGLAGANGTEGTVSNCYAAGSVTGGDYSTGVGGLCGPNSGTISDCYATPSVSGGDGASGLGGLCGANAVEGTILNCYAMGSVTGGDYSGALGGLCGDNWGTISVCYATASVVGGDNSGGLGGLCGVNTGAVYHCFWDKQTCGTLYSSGGWGMSTADMMTQSTYIAWNNGAWVIDEGRDYPRLAWENTPGAIIAYEHPRNYPGNGEDQPFELDDPEDMVCMSLRPADWDKNFVLVSDIDMSSVIDYRPVGLFTGSLDGQGHVVQNLTIDVNVVGSKNELGLFGRVGPAGQVANLSLVNVTVIGPDYYFIFLGGLCGRNDGTLSHCDASATVGGGQYLGGLCGKNDGTVWDCHATGTVTGLSYLGGLCGLIGSGGTASNCHATVSVSGGAGYSPGLGGLAGSNFGTISGCHASGSVTGGNGSEDLGGLVGENAGAGTISNCYATGSVTGGMGSLGFGGLCGQNSWGSTISNCYATGSVTGGMQGLGGLCGINWGAITASFWDVEASGLATSEGGVGLTTAEMQTASTFLDAGWDFVDETENGPNDVWKIVEGQTYPLLSWQKYGGGSGEPNDPYLIYTAEHLNALGAEPNDYDKHFKLMADIDLSGYVYNGAVIAPDMNPDDPWGEFQGTPFTGGFDGNGFTISHLTIRGDSYLGLFGQLYWGMLSNLGLEAVDVTGTGDCVGGLVGDNDGTINMSYSTGSVSGDYDVGGLVGLNAGRVSSSYSRAAVVGNGGGLVGTNVVPVNTCPPDSACIPPFPGMIQGCYAVGPVSGDSVGGLVLSGDGRFAWSLLSFWDIETTGQMTSETGVGKTTAEMQTARTFLEAGWDFVCETTNGTEDIWYMPQGGYPRLVWELEEAPPCAATVIELDETNFDETIADGVVLVGLYATWCPHCRTQAPILDDVAEQVRGIAQVAKLDIDEARSVAQAYGVSAVPTLIVFKNASIFERFVGVTEAPVLIAAIQAAIDD